MKSTLIAALWLTATCLLSDLSFAQCGWTQKANFGGTARSYAVGFSIGTKGYIGTGYDGTTNKQDFWEWDSATNVWTQKANFGGTARYGAVGFSIGTKGYIGTGYDGSYKQDFWEWEQATNVWTQKINFSGIANRGLVGFTIGTKGYIGTGLQNSGVKNDFWEYNPSLDIGPQISQQNVSCYQGSNGTATVTVNSNTPPYTYQWSSGQTTYGITGLTAGNYSVTVTNVNGCTNSATLNIAQPSSALTTVTITTTPAGTLPTALPLQILRVG